MSRFKMGQIVELDGTGIRPGDCLPHWHPSLQAGDRGTLVAGRVNETGKLEVKVLWHKSGRESWMIERWLRRYTYPMTNAPGRAQGAGATVRALAKVIDTELPHALEEAMRELERARMAAEDFRSAAFSAKRALRRGRDDARAGRVWRPSSAGPACQALCARPAKRRIWRPSSAGPACLALCARPAKRRIWRSSSAGPAHVSRPVNSNRRRTRLQLVYLVPQQK